MSVAEITHRSVPAERVGTVAAGHTERMTSASDVARQSTAGSGRTDESARTDDRPVFLYDGDCSFCTSCANFIERRIPTSARVVPWQFSDLDALGVTQADAEAAVLWVDPPRPTVAGPEAIARLLADAGSLWRPLGWVLDLPPVRWLAWPIYRFVARNRHRLPGGTAACSLPQAERDRRRAAG
jgi:predicted DCC family thiol-disulfide oxidoreductase YuxK